MPNPKLTKTSVQFWTLIHMLRTSVFENSPPEGGTTVCHCSQLAFCTGFSIQHQMICMFYWYVIVSQYLLIDAYHHNTLLSSCDWQLMLVCWMWHMQPRVFPSTRAWALVTCPCTVTVAVPLQLCNRSTQQLSDAVTRLNTIRICTYLFLYRVGQKTGAICIFIIPPMDSINFRHS